MAKLLIQVCIISAHGLHRAPSLLKSQWFAVGWINPNDKYCTKIDSSSGSNPTWKTKFSVTVDNTNSNMHAMSLTIEVYRRDPIFLREKLQGTTTVPLEKLITKFARDRDIYGSGVEETGSFQLKKRHSGKPRGSVDVSVGISEGGEDAIAPSYSGTGYKNSNNEIQLTIEDGPVHIPGNGRQLENHLNILPSGTGYRQPPTPPTPPPPANAGFLTTWFPGTAQPPPQTYRKSPPKVTSEHDKVDIGMGLGAGALAAGAAIFGDNFMSGSGNIKDINGSRYSMLEFWW